MKFNSFNILTCKELNDLCELQTQCVLNVVFTKHWSEALNPMILPLTSKDLQINFKLKSPGPTLEMMMQAIGSCTDA